MGSALAHVNFSLLIGSASVQSSALLCGCSTPLFWWSGREFLRCEFLWCELLVHLPLTASRQSLLIRAILQTITHCLETIGLPLNSPCSMARKRGLPRRGSAWEAHKAQKRRKEELERALAMATSILRKKNRAERRARLAIIAEHGAGSSQHGKKQDSDVLQEKGFEEEPPPCTIAEELPPCIVAEEFPPCIVTEEFPPCIVDEGPSMESVTPPMPMPSLLDYSPGCIVEEIPWPGDDTCNCQDSQVKATGPMAAEPCAKQEEEAANEEHEALEAGSGAAVDGSGYMHDALFRDEHLAVMIDIRGHLADLNHRALLLGQRMDMLFDALSNAPAKRRCPLCAQAFAIPVHQHG
jgi:hypothetical protein